MKGTVTRSVGGKERLRIFRGGHELAPHRPGQSAYEFGHQLEPEARHVPVEAVGGDGRKRGERHVDGDAIVLLAWRVSVRETKASLALQPLVWISRYVDVLSGVGEDVGR